MHDVILVQDLKGLKELFEDEKGIGFGKLTLLGQKVLEGASIAILVDEVEVIWSFDHIEIYDDIGMSFDVGEDVDLIDSAFL